MADRSELSKNLAKFAQGPDFDDPFSMPARPSLSSIKATVDESIASQESKTGKKKKKNKIQRLIDESTEYLSRYPDDIVNDFDTYLDRRFVDEEDSALKNSLIGMGRKYARDTQSTAEASEIIKIFSANEKRLDVLLTEVREDKKLVQKDLDGMRSMRTRNFKTLSELVASKTQAHNTELSVIKELNRMKKDQLDLQSKASKATADAGGDGVADTSRAIQQLFGLGRGNLISSVGGYEGVSGAISEDDVAYYENSPSDEVIQRAHFNNDDDDRIESDGDKFLRYEKSGVGYILLVDSIDGSKQVIAEDSQGNYIGDYPMPSNIDQLTFDINPRMMTATDDLHREYTVRYINQDTPDED